MGRAQKGSLDGKQKCACVLERAAIKAVNADEGCKQKRSLCSEENHWPPNGIS